MVLLAQIAITEVNKLLDWLVDIRGDRSQYEVSRLIGIPQSSYASIECENRRPSVKMAKRIALGLGFEWTRFFEDNDAEGGETHDEAGT
jgi:transcriptional regulator with XRE-family HTH domain